MIRHYLLDGHRAYQVRADTEDGSYLEWATAWTKMDRQVALDLLPMAQVSTVFLGIDHGWFADRPPLIFETMVFAHPALKGSMVDYCERCSTWEEAEAVHARVMKELLLAHQEAAG